MNKIRGVLVSILLIAIFMGTFSVEGLVPTTPPTAPTPQVTSVDINVVNLVPGLTFQPGNGLSVITGIGVNSGFFATPVNATASFSFTPVKGFTSVDSVTAMIVYLGGTGGYNAFGVQLNHQAASNIPTTTVQNTAVGSLRAQDLHDGANTISVGIVLDGSSLSGSTYVFQVRLTVEYTFVG